MRLVRSACQGGVAGVVVTHDAQLASWADRVVFLRDGRISDQTDAAARPGVVAHAGPRPVSTTLQDRPAATGRLSGGAPARRAVVRWSWRLFRREWRQQLTVIGLLTVGGRRGRRRDRVRGRRPVVAERPVRHREPPADHLRLGRAAGGRCCERQGGGAVRPDRGDRARDRGDPRLGEHYRRAGGATGRALLEPRCCGWTPGTTQPPGRSRSPAASRRSTGCASALSGTRAAEHCASSGSSRTRVTCKTSSRWSRQVSSATPITSLSCLTPPTGRSGRLACPTARCCRPGRAAPPASRLPRCSSSTRSRCCSSG